MKLRYEKCMANRVFKEPQRDINDKYLKIDGYIRTLENTIKNKQKEEKTKYVELLSKLDTLSPLKTLTRGYSLIENNKKIAKTINDLQKGDIVSIRLKDGKKEAEILN